LSGFAMLGEVRAPRKRAQQVAPGLRQSASEWHIPHTTLARTLNLFVISIGARRLALDRGSP